MTLEEGDDLLAVGVRCPNAGLRVAASGEIEAQVTDPPEGCRVLDGAVPADVAGRLRRIQNDLFDVGADISVPEGGERERLRLRADQTGWLEQACDEVNAGLEPLRSFVLPGGTPLAAHLHVARTVCRRAERRALDVGPDLNAEVVRYLNRLSDLLFILARAANEGEEPLWEPGRHR